MADYLNHMKNYWDGRFASESHIWGSSPSITAVHALELFRNNNAKRILVPGAGYGRNSKLFSDAGFEVTGIEISSEAISLARQYDPQTTFYLSSVLNLPLEKEKYDAIYCFNVLHLFRLHERKQFIEKCHYVLRKNGVAYFVVFSDNEKSFGKGQQVEENTFESKPGRPVHYFTERDLKDHFMMFSILETGIANDRENHGDEGPHIHQVRYIVAEKT